MKHDIELHQRRLASGGALPTAPAAVQGMVIVFTGNGKGKSSAAFGMAQRALAHQIKVGVVQFLGGSVNSAEYRSLAANPLCDFQICGTDCHWEGKDRHLDQANVNHAWDKAQCMMDDPEFGMVVLDDINLLMKHPYLDMGKVMNALRNRRRDLHVIMTGRYASMELIDYADLATEMRDAKYDKSKKPLLPYEPLPPQAGIEF